MIRGVNKQIIEINDTGSKYFEKALLFVSSSYSSQSTNKLQNEAVKIVNSFGAPPIAKRKKYRISRRALIALIILLSAALAVSVVMQII